MHENTFRHLNVDESPFSFDNIIFKLFVKPMVLWDAGVEVPYQHLIIEQTDIELIRIPHTTNQSVIRLKENYH